MIDLHCHILPEIDDGPSDIKTSLEMMKIAGDDKITHIAATPHFRYGERPTVDEIRMQRERLQAAAIAEGLDIKLLSGADIRLTYEFLECITRNEVPTINNSRYFLLELPDLIPPHVDELLFEAKIKGYVPIITHPERNYSLLSNHDKIGPLREAGTLFQLTAMSITGALGRDVRAFSQYLLKQGLADFVSSDAHNTSRRTPVLSEAFNATRKILNAEEAERIFIANPKAVIDNLEIYSSEA